MVNYAAVEVRGLRVVRGGRPVLDDLDLDVAAGTLTGLLGPSGSGKTTFMRAVVGVQRVAGGTVSVLGLPAGSRALRSQVGYLTQAPSVYPDLTVRQNLRYFARLLGGAGRAGTTAADVSRVVEQVDLVGAADQQVGTLSGGQRTRVSLATALLGSPRLLVLDEPTVGLDPVLRRDLWRMFADLSRAGVTILVSSHVMDEAERCEQLHLMRDGRLLAHEPPAALLQRTGAVDVEQAFLALVEGHRGPTSAEVSR